MHGEDWRSGGLCGCVELADRIRQSHRLRPIHGIFNEVLAGLALVSEADWPRMGEANQGCSLHLGDGCATEGSGPKHDDCVEIGPSDGRRQARKMISMMRRV
jgi:hypothetical protein